MGDSMSFSAENIKSLAKLARMSLNDEEIVSTQKELSKIVSYIETLMEVDVDGVEPLVHAVPTQLPQREDVQGEQIGQEGLKGSAGYEDGLVQVPKIIE